MKNKSSIIKVKQSIFNEIFSKQLDRILEFSLEDRLGYKCYLNAYIGLEDEDKYNHELYLTEKKCHENTNIILFNQCIDGTDNVQLINHLRLKLNKANLNCLEKEDIHIVNDVNANMRIKKGLDEIFRISKGTFANESIKINFIIKQLVWCNLYVDKIRWIKEDTPKCIYYGDIKKHESYFLYLLNLIGFDILYLNPRGLGQMNILNINEQILEIQEYACIEKDEGFDKRIAKGEVVDKSIIKKAVTDAAQVSKEVSKELYKQVGIIKPWELQNKYLNTIVLSSTFDEIEIYWKEPVKLRPGFNVGEDYVEIPVFFTKINGVHEEIQAYNGFIERLRKAEYTLFIEWEEGISKLVKPFVRDAYRLSYMFKEKDKLDKEKMINNTEFTIATLKRNLQYLLMDKLQEIFDANYFIDALTKEDKVKLLYSLLNPCSDILLLVENFDYGNINPKLMIYIKERIIFSKEYACLLLLLSKLGFDIIIFSPTGSSSIENVINEKLIDSHRLQTVDMNLNISLNSSINSSNENNIGNLFKNLFKKRR